MTVLSALNEKNWLRVPLAISSRVLCPSLTYVTSFGRYSPYTELLAEENIRAVVLLIETL
jgi:hypothetical protein